VLSVTETESQATRRRSHAVTTTNTLRVADADVVYDVHGQLPSLDGRPPLLMIGQPMDASQRLRDIGLLLP